MHSLINEMRDSPPILASSSKKFTVLMIIDKGIVPSTFCIVWVCCRVARRVLCQGCLGLLHLSALSGLDWMFSAQQPPKRGLCPFEGALVRLLERQTADKHIHLNFGGAVPLV